MKHLQKMVNNADTVDDLELVLFKLRREAENLQIEHDRIGRKRKGLQTILNVCAEKYFKMKGAA